MLNFPVIITPLRNSSNGDTSFWIEVIYLRHLLIKYILPTRIQFAKIDVKSIIYFSRPHFFADVKDWSNDNNNNNNTNTNNNNDNKINSNSDNIETTTLATI